MHGKRFVDCFLVRRKKRSTLMEENENAKRLSLPGTLKRPEPTSQSRFSFASWPMVITDDFENSSKSFNFIPSMRNVKVYLCDRSDYTELTLRQVFNAMIKYSSIPI